MSDRFSYVPCSVCDSDDWQLVYSSLQNVSDAAGEVQVDLVMCNQCAFLYNNPQPSPELLTAHYQVSSSGSVFREVKPGTRASRLTGRRIDFISGFLVDRTPGRILDVGCGNGFFLDSLPAEGWEKTGIDISPASGKNISDAGITLIAGDILEYETTSRYDLITCFSSFEHFRQPQLILKKLHSLLQPGGVVIIDVPDTSYPVPGLEEYFCFEHLSSFTRPTLTMLFNRYKFEVVEVAETTPECRSILCAARSCESVTAQMTEEPARIHKILENYRDLNSALKDGIRDQLEAFLSPLMENQGNIAVYGAGFHNYFLFKLFEFETLVSCFIDSDPAKWGTELMGRKIIPPADIDGLKVDAILISSHHFESEIFDTIAKFNTANLPVKKLYNEQF